MHDFRYKNNALYCESVKVSSVAKGVRTPFYLYSHKTLADHFHKLKNAFRAVNPLICFSMKANSNLAVCSSLIKEGAGLDIVSGGELFRALKIGADPRKIVYSGVGKTRDELEEALKADILFFNVESIAELNLLDEVANRLGARPNVSLRLNPDVAVKTHRYVVTGMSHSKFGLNFDAARRILERRAVFTNLKINGLHIHIGSQITNSRPFVRALRRVISFIKKNHIAIDYLNIGGGLGIIYNREKPQTAKRFARAVLPLLRKVNAKIILEPGRFIAGNSGILVTKVLYTKESINKNFIIVDAGMNDLVRPSLYEAYHLIQPVMKHTSRRSHYVVADIVGPICESGDFMAKNRRIQRVSEGDLLAVMSAGAYGFTMSSNYNSRPKLSEVMVIGNKFYVVRERESYEDLIRGETIPRVLK